eukprot:735382-Amphidinium_carterae.2
MAAGTSDCILSEHPPPHFVWGRFPEQSTRTSCCRDLTLPPRCVSQSHGAACFARRNLSNVLNKGWPNC